MKITNDELTELMLIDGVLHDLGERVLDKFSEINPKHMTDLEKRLSKVINSIKQRPVSFLENLNANR
jgi:acetyl-CoA carboxylase alpha subunit